MGLGMTRSRLTVAAGACAVAAGLAIVASAAGPAGAAPNGSTTANASVTSSITLSGLTPSFTLTGNPSTTVNQNSAVTMNVLTNNRTGYNVTVQAAAATMAPATPGNTDSVPIGNLKVREAGTVTFSSLSNTAAATVHVQAGKSSATGDTITNDYQLAVPFVNADNYSVVLNYLAATT